MTCESIELTNEIIDKSEIDLSKEMMLRLLELNKKLKPLRLKLKAIN